MTNSGYYLNDTDPSSVEFYNGGWILRTRLDIDSKTDDPKIIEQLNMWRFRNREKYKSIACG